MQMVAGNEKWGAGYSCALGEKLEAVANNRQALWRWASCEAYVGAPREVVMPI